MAPKADKFGRQIRYADRRGIPYVWFGSASAGEVKDIRSGDQVPADPATLAAAEPRTCGPSVQRRRLSRWSELMTGTEVLRRRIATQAAGSTG